MQWQFNSYVLTLAIIGAISVVVASFAWRHRSASGATALFYLMLGGCIWSWTYAVEIGSYDLPTKVFMSQVMYIGVVSIPVIWLIMAFQYAGRDRWLTTRNLVLLGIIPVITLALTWTNGVNDGHGLIWKHIELDFSGSFAAWDVTYGSFIWVSAGYGYLLILLGSLQLISTVTRLSQFYRGQIGVMLVASLTPLVGNVLYLSGMNPFPGLDLTPFMFTLSGLMMLWAILRFRLFDFDIVPVARDAIMEGLSHSVLILNTQNRVVDLNPNAEQITGHPAAEVIGQRIEQVFPHQASVFEYYRDIEDAHTDFLVGQGETRRTYDMYISPLYVGKHKHLSGRLVTLQDITERKREQVTMERRSQQLQAAAEVGQAAVTLRNLDELMPQVTQLISQRFSFYHVGIFLLDDHHEFAVLQAANSESGQRMLNRGHRLKVGEVGIVGYVTAQQEARIALDVGTDAVFFDNPDLPETRSEMALPLIIGGELLGAIDVQSKREAAFSDEDINVLQILADQIAIAIENARLFTEHNEALKTARRAYSELSQEAWGELLRTQPELGFISTLARDTYKA
ncbi:MAG: histidine kinase N-terminal 7TM domain-containing protein, partial [Chloroflexota bacterium]|nr:histidine kinase N-terminal 7TM domain-containing protein [Chloroflexota bacterium]